MADKVAEAMAALFAHAALMETQGPTLPVSFPEPDKDFVPPEDGRYLEVALFSNTPRWEGVRSGRVDQGLLQVNVVWPKNQGLIKPGQKADQVIAHFAKNARLFSGGTRVTINLEPYAGSALPDADAVTIPVTIPWLAA